ncbi:PTS sugar transporter subunit IIB [Lacrimispora saccharolytica]|uniref:PTS system sorbose subfamily IIB component n=1 Tax=Lacrimispora saccharolytica (strain ATCC 35040 / DSM 2544 / NRCC 2533 / WM1) TaxID=610130 RepID=D9R9M7_LACSW|nr:PTS sugar transporter subunit IIB [Lacrimispora saccharolytica]ADL04077.1 PTS system sorbose subfamily IIB component [[Clostridium] saccharolyticum WM1]QRV21628.1 PTS sugar transporter subunit IIB [Lacrimispora saccharolytica]
MIKMIRVDYRLLHGQVAFSWTSMLGADCLLLVSNTIRDDPLRMQTLKLAKPEGVKVVVKNSEDAVSALQSGVADKYQLFIICETIELAAEIAKAVKMKSINLGNIPFAEGKRQVSKSVFLDREEEERLKEMRKDGYDLYIQMVPTEKKINCQTILD